MVQTFIPNYDDAFDVIQSMPDTVDFTILTGAHAPTGIVSGCAGTASGTPDMVTHTAAGIARLNGRRFTVTSSDDTHTAADGTNPRIDLVVVDVTDTKTVIAGTPEAVPEAPAYTVATQVVLRSVLIPATDTQITTGQITDKRITVPNTTIHNIEWFGAVGDDSTDNATALAACATEAADETIFVPNGIFRTTAFFGFGQGTSLKGVSPKSSVIKCVTASAGFVVRVTGSGGDGAEEMGSISEVTVMAAAANTSGILLTDTVHYTIRNTYVNCSTSSTPADRVGATCIRAEYSAAGSARTRIDNVNVRHAVGSGYEFDGGVADWCNRNTITQAVAWDCGTGVKFMSGSDTNWVQLDTEACDVGVDMGDSQETVLFWFSENDGTALDLNACTTCTLNIGVSTTTVDIDASGTATHNILIGRWDPAKVTNNENLFDGENILLMRPNGTQEAYVAAKEFQMPGYRVAERQFMTGNWTTGSQRKAYIDFGDIEFTGMMEVEITGAQASGTAYGKVAKRMSFRHALGGTSLLNLETDFYAVHGQTPSKFTIEDPEIHTTDNFRVPITRITDTTTTALAIIVRVYHPILGTAGTSAALDLLDAATLVAPAVVAHSETEPVLTYDNGKPLVTPVVEVAGATTLDWSHGVVNVDTSGGAVTLTLPDNATQTGKSYLVHRDGASNVVINRAGSDTFDDAATSKTLGSDGAGIGFYSIGDGEWKIVATTGTVT